jgi:hypothetical protein
LSSSVRTRAWKQQRNVSLNAVGGDALEPSGKLMEFDDPIGIEIVGAQAFSISINRPWNNWASDITVICLEEQLAAYTCRW